MEIVAFTSEPHHRRPRVGAVFDNQYLLDFERAYEEGVHPPSSLDWYDMDGPWYQKSCEVFDRMTNDASLIARAADNGALVERSDAYWFAPVPRPGKLICIGLNYRDHAAELGMPLPQRPVVFSKFTTAVIAAGEPIKVPASSTQVDYEAELAIVIGRRAKNVRADDAMRYVFGYTAFNDVTARDFQAGDGQWQRSKSCDTFAPMGPSIFTADTIKDPSNLGIRLTVNGNTMQDSNTNQLVFGVPELIEFLSSTITLEPGDVIATGTPPGVGAGKKPPVFLKPGDVVAVEIEGLKPLSNPVAN
jgi:2-keto-4-pentenoate hydratase/2-oxohepta-3-ene-1,7-dioic acid hydratase in catechol pathway